MFQGSVGIFQTNPRYYDLPPLLFHHGSDEPGQRVNGQQLRKSWVQRLDLSEDSGDFLQMILSPQMRGAITKLGFS